VWESLDIVEEEMDDDETDPAAPAKRPGPVYDRAMRGVVANDPAAVCRVFGIAVTTESGAPELISASFASPQGVGHTDALLRVGPDRLAHLEYQCRAVNDLVARLWVYLGAIMSWHPEAQITQYVLVLGKGTVEEPSDETKRDFWKRVVVIFLREMDPAVFLSEVNLSPMAVLARGSLEERTEVFRTALISIQKENPPRLDNLLDYAATLARITLDKAKVRKITDEVVMSDVMVQEFAGEIFSETEWGRALERKGVRAGHERTLGLVLKDRFGDRPGLLDVASRLSRWPDDAAAVHAIFSAGSLEELVLMEAPE
jgi:hypothetical protein